MILSGQTIRRRNIITPFAERTVSHGMTYGLGPAGYDVRLAQSVSLSPGAFFLGSTIERFDMPRTVLGEVKDKSSWARRGLALQNTVIEPSWRGFLTLELTNHSLDTIQIEVGSPIAQIIFYLFDEPAEQPYNGKYQDQPPRPVSSLFQDDGS